MNEKYIKHVAESKKKYHKNQAKITFEEKFKKIIELQIIDSEFHKSERSSKNKKENKKVWQLEI